MNISSTAGGNLADVGHQEWTVFCEGHELKNDVLMSFHNGSISIDELHRWILNEGDLLVNGCLWNRHLFLLSMSPKISYYGRK